MVPRGHRLRLAVSTTDWPQAWPSPKSARLTVLAGGSALIVPVRTGSGHDEGLRPFETPEGAEAAPRRLIEAGHHNWLIHRDLASDQSTLEVINDNGIVHLEDIDLEVENRAFEWYTSRGDDFLSAKGETRLIRGLRRGDWSIRTVARTQLTATKTSFRIAAELDAFEDGLRVFARNWDVSIPRDFA